MKILDKTLEIGSKAIYEVGKKSPLLLTIGAIICGGCCVYTSLKAKDKLHEDMDKINEREVNGETVKTSEVVKTVIKDVWKPTLLGVAAVGCVVTSYFIQDNRITAVNSLLTAAYAHHDYVMDKIKETYGEEVAKELETPVTVETPAVGRKPKVYKADDKILPSKLTGVWYKSCGTYVSDDHAYNISYLENLDREIDEYLAKPEHYAMSKNHLHKLLDLETSAKSAAIGWNRSTWKGLNWDVYRVEDPITGEMKPEIYVSWAKPIFIYDDVE